MRELHLGDGVLVTTDRIAHAVLDYTRALMRLGSEGTVDIPFARSDGSAGSARLLLGGRQNPWTADAASARPIELDDGDALRDLRTRTATLDNLAFFDQFDL
jgi:hypothetical protein